MTSSADLTFIHLSDIHFRKGRVGTRHDADEELRDQLAADLRRLAPRFGAISGVIITGDVAWSGHKREYQYADGWIRRVTEQLRCSLSDVMVPPGNHDVYRPELKKNAGRIEKLQRNVRTGGKAAICVDRLANALSGRDGKHFIAPLRAYNGFAKNFGCAISATDPYWERAFTLGDGATLCIRGITSTWLSGPKDSEIARRLLYGAAQYTFTKTDKKIYVVAGHHPPQNTIDSEEAERSFELNCKLQLFGHKHYLWITESRDSARIIAGALHPDRREKPWIPRYNILQISTEITERARILSINVYPRRWSEEFGLFMADYTPEAKEVRALQFFY